MYPRDLFIAGSEVESLKSEGNEDGNKSERRRKRDMFAECGNRWIAKYWLGARGYTIVLKVSELNGSSSLVMCTLKSMDHPLSVSRASILHHPLHPFAQFRALRCNISPKIASYIMPVSLHPFFN